MMFKSLQIGDKKVYPTPYYNLEYAKEINGRWKIFLTSTSGEAFIIETTEPITILWEVELDKENPE
jgi:hypothetical protein